MQAGIVSSLEELRLVGGHGDCIRKNTIYGNDGKGSALATSSQVPSSTGLRMHYVDTQTQLQLVLTPL